MSAPDFDQLFADCARAGASAADAPALALALDDLRQRHLSPPRAYHNWGHVEQLLRLGLERQDRFENWHLAAWAIFFHDAIYQPGRADNEERSAALLLAQSRRLGMAEPFAQAAASIVRHTANHAQAPDQPSDMALVLDLDLSTLAADWPEYLAYAQAIRQEHANVPALLFRPGRAKVLRALLEAPRLFRHPESWQSWEAKARENLRRELLSLEA